MVGLANGKSYDLAPGRRVIVSILKLGNRPVLTRRICLTPHPYSPTAQTPTTTRRCGQQDLVRRRDPFLRLGLRTYPTQPNGRIDWLLWRVEVSLVSG